ncbi:UDP-2,3-diacylglucosamine diphosphatase [Undibacterium sp. SXout7W]|uniref:UDP-2,3-diacylglucosamine diphosphatase n=1 Tax=Undibacterium sp. SXout7W TaxID=3413049 RepID=UPI003BF34073
MKHDQLKTKAQDHPLALFVSDIHLSPDIPKTTHCFLAFLENYAIHSERLYLLGDLFEYWAGDDAISEPYNQVIVNALRDVSRHGTNIYWIAGNRDFLVSKDFFDATGVTPLHDGDVIQISDKRIVLAHGDAQCTDDIDYIAFRKDVRRPEWQKNFLALPLAQRQSIIAGLRKNSQMEQKNKSAEIMDVNESAIADLFSTSATKLMIHGHTHRPAMHQAGETIRYVLPDWDCETTKYRGGWISISKTGNILRHDINGEIQNN